LIIRIRRAAGGTKLVEGFNWCAAGFAGLAAGGGESGVNCGMGRWLWSYGD